jgi:nicotinate-nucleotide adenylyltransferase
MGQVKLENKKKIGILGGTFDPAHIGHITISKTARKKFKLNQVIWAITNKNPFKKKSSLSLKDRIKYAKNIIQKNKFIKIRFYEKKIKSNKTIDLIKYFIKKNRNSNIYFIMGADNLVNFHKWKKSNQIPNLCKILVFDRNGYKSKSLKSPSFKRYNKKGINFIKFKKVNISSSQLRKI